MVIAITQCVRNFRSCTGTENDDDDDVSHRLRSMFFQITTSKTETKTKRFPTT